MALLAQYFKPSIQLLYSHYISRAVLFSTIDMGLDDPKIRFIGYVFKCKHKIYNKTFGMGWNWSKLTFAYV